MNKRPVMLTVVSHSFPPRITATALILKNLLSVYKGSLSAIGGCSNTATLDKNFSPPCTTLYLKLPNMFPRLYGRIRHNFPNLMRLTIQPSIKRKLTQLGAKIVLGVFPQDECLVAAFLAARQLQLPFYVYMQDLWLENESPGSARRQFAEKWEPVVFKEATRVICMTEAAQRHYERKYQIKTYLLPHSIPESEFARAPRDLTPPDMPNPTAVFMGALGQKFNVDALRVLTRASESLPEKYQLLFSTPVKMEILKKLGIWSSRLQVTYIPRHHVKKFLSESHVLIAPISHKNCTLEEVYTIFSTKLLDYMLSGRPIIVFAPKGSYIAEYAIDKGWAYVVTEDSPHALSEAIVKVIEDKDLARKLVKAALVEARARGSSTFADQLFGWVKDDVELLAAG